MRLEWLFRFRADNGDIHSDRDAHINGGFDDHDGVAPGNHRGHHDHRGTDRL
jgi:hypothetical protein